MRIRKKKWARTVFFESERIIGKDFDGAWEKYFNNENDICVELGCGKGKFITRNALEFKGKNFVAVEKYLDIIASAVKKAEDYDLRNVFFIMDDIKNLEKYFLRPQVSELYINFCDPWPKNKHIKRRLTHKTFLDMYKKILLPEGRIFFKTDNKNLFDFSLKEFANNGFKLGRVLFDLHKEKPEVNNIETEYEEKFMRLNMPIFYCEASQIT